MELEQAKEILLEWVKSDREYRNHETESDFDEFCETRNIAIEVVLNKLKEG